MDKEPRTFLEPEMSSGAKLREGAIKALAVLGVIALLAIGLWGSVQIVRSIPNAFSSLSAAIVSLTSVFDRDNTPGGISTSTTSGTGTSTSSVGATSTPSKPGTGTTTPSKPTYKTPYGTPRTVTVQVPFVPKSDPNGYVDLSVRIVAVGKIVNTATNEFATTTSVTRADRAAVKFEVTNLGTKISPSWGFDADLPTSPIMTYHAPSQDALYPGQVAQFVIGFNELVRSSSGVVTINLDPKATIIESNKGNNVVSTTITINP